MIDIKSMLRLVVLKSTLIKLYELYKEEVDNSSELKSMFAKKRDELVSGDTDNPFILQNIKDFKNKSGL